MLSDAKSFYFFHSFHKLLISKPDARSPIPNPLRLA